MALKWQADRAFENDYRTTPPTQVPKPTFDGLVVGTFSRTERIMSDVWADVFYVRVWDEAEGRVRDWAYGNSEFGSSAATVTVDASDAVKAKAAAWDALKATEAAQREVEASIDREVRAAKRLGRGKDVDVVRGRKVKIGTKGRIFWIGETRFGERVGLELADGSRVFTASSNVVLAQPDEDLDTDRLMAERAKAAAAVAKAAAVLNALPAAA